MNELASRVDGRQPEAELVGEVVARAACAVTLDERSGTEVFQTRTRTGQRLTAAIRTGTGVLLTNTQPVKSKYICCKLEKVALDGSVECCAPPPGWRDLEL